MKSFQTKLTFQTKLPSPSIYYVKSKPQWDDYVTRKRKEQEKKRKPTKTSKESMRDYAESPNEPTYYAYIKRSRMYKGKPTGEPYWETEEIPSLQVDRRKKELYEEYKKGLNKGYFISNDPKKIQDYLKLQTLREKQEEKRAQREMALPGYETIKKELTTGTKRFVKQFGDRTATTRDVEIMLPVAPAPRSRFYSQPSPNYQERSSFSSQVVPYRPIGKSQTFAPYRPISFGATPRPQPQTLFKPKKVFL